MTRRTSRTVLSALAAVSMAGAVQAQTLAQPAKDTPSGWNYEIKDGKRVPKGTRKLNADGSWREEVRNGACVTIKEKTASGEYKESRRCD
jgi:hypothetical protein